MLRRGESISESSQGGCDEEDNTESVPTPAMSSSSNSNRKEKDGSDSTTIGKKETRAVVRSKLLVYGVLIMAATAVTVYWYTFLKKAEQSSFEEQAVEVAHKIIEAADASAKESFGRVVSISNELTSYALSTNATWPFVTLPHFDIRSTESFEKRKGSELIFYAPIVRQESTRRWEQYAVERQGWIVEDLFYRGLRYVRPGNVPREVYPYFKTDERTDFVTPLWQMGPVPTNASIVNLDLYTHPSFRRMIDDSWDQGNILLSEVVDVSFLVNHVSYIQRAGVDNHPRSYVVQPVYDGFGAGSKIVGFVFAVVPWDSYFIETLTNDLFGFRVDVTNTCGDSFAYLINGPNAMYLGKGDETKRQHTHLQQTADFAAFARWNGPRTPSSLLVHCEYTLDVTPTDAFKATYESNEPLVYAMMILGVFFFTAMVFVIYDCAVQRRQNLVMATAKRSHLIISSLFPRNIQERIMEEVVEQEKQGRKDFFRFSAKARLSQFLNSGVTDDGNDQTTKTGIFSTKPLADLFPETTVMFGDIVGFTAWSSTREPSQVFRLLESIYHSFDEIAKRRRVFKVETVGDCYVAVTGLPTPRKDHARVMARFATECLNVLQEVLLDLEVSLGPDTTSLGMRVGLHSGPVTAGVLRGEKARFQLFGDTMNTCARMESTGESGRIQCSEQTAQLLIDAGKGHWLSPRESRIVAKGKGELKTYWLAVKEGSVGSRFESSHDMSTDFEVANECAPDQNPLINLNDKLLRLVNWNVEVLSNLIKEIVARRKAMGNIESSPKRLSDLEKASCNPVDDIIAIDEVKEIIFLPKFDAEAARNEVDPEKIELPDGVAIQLKSYVMTLASLYRDNPFHNFEHASHVAMSVTKLLSRIVAPDLEDTEENHVASSLHDHTYGITSDPLTQFSVVLSALIHDADHRGIPNMQLIKEDPAIASVYKGKSVAEQNSFDLSWELLMQEEYTDLRRVIYKTEEEFKRFRQLVINTVMATDIMDKDLKELRNMRWSKAFSGTHEDRSVEDSINRKATIVIEHLIQASDVAHTMQHWHIYRRWNERFFAECYKAYQEGRAENDPAVNWYKGEIGFFDFYIIPLAKKLKDCGVFGVSSDEYLMYAQQNRLEWQDKGLEVVEEMLEKFKTTGIKGLYDL